jgi:hypothetical protein
LELSAATIEKIARLEPAIRRDPGRRGLLQSNDVRRDDLGAGELLRAAASLSNARQVAILTGFYIPLGDSNGSAETDGPLGAALLGQVLSHFGIPVQVITDPNCAEVVRTAVAKTNELAPTERHPEVVILPSADYGVTDYWSTDFGQSVTHIVSIERVGPSFVVSDWDDEKDGDAAEFSKLVHSDLQNKCYNMRGVDVSEYSYDLHELFANVPSHVVRIAIGDGGNEIGMGKFGWQTIFARLACPAESNSRNEQDQERRTTAARIPCRLSADHTILAGVSNWGADALAASVCLMRGDTKPLRAHNQDAHERVLEAIVNEAGAVDGVTKLREPTVDGLPFITYIQTWNALAQAAGL